MTVASRAFSTIATQRVPVSSTPRAAASVATSSAPPKAAPRPARSAKPSVPGGAPPAAAGRSTRIVAGSTPAATRASTSRPAAASAASRSATLGGAVAPGISWSGIRRSIAEPPRYDGPGVTLLHTEPAAFVYLGSRTYVHGTTMLARLAGAVGRLAPGAATLPVDLFAVRTELVGADGTLEVHRGPAPVDGPAPIAELRTRLDGEAVTALVLRAEGTTVAERDDRDRERELVRDVVLDAPFSGSATLVGVADEHEFVRAFVEPDEAAPRRLLDGRNPAIRWVQLRGASLPRGLAPQAEARDHGGARRRGARPRPRLQPRALRDPRPRRGRRDRLLLPGRGRRMTVGIRGVATYLPDEVLGNDELIERFGWDRVFLEEKLGIRERRRAAADELCSDVAVKAAERLFARHPELDRDAIDLLVLVTQNPDHGLPHRPRSCRAASGCRRRRPASTSGSVAPGSSTRSRSRRRWSSSSASGTP